MLEIFCPGSRLKSLLFLLAVIIVIVVNKMPNANAKAPKIANNPVSAGIPSGQYIVSPYPEEEDPIKSICLLDLLVSPVAINILLTEEKKKTHSYPEVLEKKKNKKTFFC